jgi:hypothetical protein
MIIDILIGFGAQELLRMQFLYTCSVIMKRKFVKSALTYQFHILGKDSELTLILR